MTTVNVYLTFDGNCKAAFDFYKSVLGGEYTYFATFEEMPPQEGMPPIAEQDKNKVMHVSLPISKETILMGSDNMDPSGTPLIIGNNFSISVNTPNRNETDKIFTALSQGGKVIMPLADTFWNAYFGMFTDKFGINWMVSCEQQTT